MRDRNGVFVARYLIRNLSDYDRTTITKDPALTARVDIIPSDSALIAEIMKHVRAKEASGGGTCFISFTHSKHKIVGSTGAEFYRPEKGDVLIDASKLVANSLVDLHSLAAVTQIFGVADVDPGMAFREGDEAYEQNAAARDTIRTREILVAGHVPSAAVVAVRLDRVKGWRTADDKAVTLPKGIPDAWVK